MKIINLRLPEDHNFYLLSDLHEGTIHQDSGAIDDVVKLISQDKQGYVAILGDCVEATQIDHPHYLPSVQREITLPLEQYKRVVNKLQLLTEGNKLVTIMDGNHDLRLMRAGIMVRDVLCAGLQGATEYNMFHFPLYGTYTCIVDTGHYKIFMTHGRKTLSTTARDPDIRRANLRKQLRDRLAHKMGDCLVMARAHTHRLLVASPVPELFLYTDQKRKRGKSVRQAYQVTKPYEQGAYIDPDQRWYVSTGGFLRNYVENVSGYGEHGDYDPLEIGYAVVICRNGVVTNVEERRM